MCLLLVRVAWTLRERLWRAVRRLVRAIGIRGLLVEALSPGVLWRRRLHSVFDISTRSESHTRETTDALATGER